MGARDDAAGNTSMVWGTAAPLVGCLPAARQKACRLARNRKSFPLQRATTLSRRRSPSTHAPFVTRPLSVSAARRPRRLRSVCVAEHWQPWVCGRTVCKQTSSITSQHGCRRAQHGCGAGTIPGGGLRPIKGRAHQRAGTALRRRSLPHRQGQRMTGMQWNPRRGTGPMPP